VTGLLVQNKLQLQTRTKTTTTTTRKKKNYPTNCLWWCKRLWCAKSVIVLQRLAHHPTSVWQLSDTYDIIYLRVQWNGKQPGSGWCGIPSIVRVTPWSHIPTEMRWRNEEMEWRDGIKSTKAVDWLDGWMVTWRYTIARVHLHKRTHSSLLSLSAILFDGVSCANEQSMRTKL